MGLERVLRAIDRAAERWDLDSQSRAPAPHPRRQVNGRLAEHVAAIRASLRRGAAVKAVARAYQTQPKDIRAIRDGRSYPEMT